MPESSSADITLQVCFGIFGVIGLLVAIAGIHHRDSLGCVLFRRLRRQRTRIECLYTRSFTKLLHA